MKTWHGSKEVEEGKLVGSTDTDYFYFHCPRCGDTEVLQINDFKIIKDGPVEYARGRQERKRAKRDFIIAFELHCLKCGLEDFVKVSNIGWQGGQLKRSPIFSMVGCETAVCAPEANS